MDKEDNRKIIFIVGSGASAYALAKKFAGYDNIAKVYVTGTNNAMKDFAETVDIREDNVNELLEFVLENAVDMTIAISKNAIMSDIAGLFQSNAQPIFAPLAASAPLAVSRSYAKKLLYKHHIPTPKFGIFEKSSIAMDYLKKTAMPVLITPDKMSDNSVMSACSTVDFARACVDDFVINNEDKIIVEDFVRGHNFTVYTVTDGYKVLPLAVAADYKFLDSGDGGLYTCGSGAFVPDYKISNSVLSKIMSNIENILYSLEQKGVPYVGILGVECIITDNEKFVTTGFTPFLKDHDAQAVLNSIDENLYTLFEACTIGSFADDYDNIAGNNLASVSAVLYSRNDGNVISGLDMLDDNTEVSFFTGRRNDYFEYETNRGRTLVLTQKSATISSARKQLYENIDVVNFSGKKYRSDIAM